MSALANRFSYRGLRKLDGSRPLNEIEMREVAPSIFAAEAHESRSARYSYVPTIDVLHGLQQHGFVPFMVAQSSSRIPGKSNFTKHMIRMRHPDQLGQGGAPEIILINSHDGTSSYQMLGGWWEFVCQNGLLRGTTGEDIRIKHSGNIIDNVIEGAHSVLTTLGAMNDQRDDMLGVRLPDEARRAFAKAALELRYDTDENGNSKSPIAPERLLTAHRAEEQRDQNSLWRTFNIVQENSIRGGLRGRTADNKRTRTREVTGLDQSTKLNKALWVLAEEMRNIMAKAA